MKNVIKNVLLVMTVLVIALAAFSPIKAYAANEGETIEEEADSSAVSGKAMAAGIALAGAAGGGALGMGLAIAKSSEGISRQPEAEGKIRTTLMLGLVFIETAIIYALVVAILIIFVL